MASETHHLKLIVGIDYGTTYSGISFALSNATDFQDIFPWTKYPEACAHIAEHNEKAPTRIAFADENVELRYDVWGYQVQPRLRSCALTKLLLDESTQSDYDDPSLFHSGTGSQIRLPPGRTAEDVVSAYLKGLYKMFKKETSRIFSCMGAEELPIEFWLTVPASWSERAKLLTKRAAYRAGFGTRPTDRVMLISEPEAAAHYALKSGIHRLRKFVQPNTGIMVCDCGGGTVDITTYEVTQTEPTVKLREIIVGIAGKCGSTYIDRNFHKLLAERFGKAFTSLGADDIGPGSDLMDNFERFKKDFSGTPPSSSLPQMLRLRMPLLEETPELKEFYDMRTSSILLTHDDMNRLFRPAIAATLKLIQDQVSRAEKITGPSIDTIVLVGGFASSPYLRDSVFEWCAKRKINLTTPMSGAWSAVVRGAVLRGLEGCIVRERKCRRHYGCTVSLPYIPQLHGRYRTETRRVWRDPFKKADYLNGFMDWQISKGEPINSTSEANLLLPTVGSDKNMGDTCTWRLYSCNLDEAPETVESNRIELVGRVHFHLNPTILSTLETTVYEGKTYMQADLTLNVRLDDQMGHLVFRVLHNGKQVGRAEIEMDD